MGESFRRILRQRRPRRVALAVFGAALIAGATSPARAAGPDDGGSPPAQAPRRARPEAPLPAPDFFLGEPKGWFSLRGGLLVPRAGGDLFRFVGDQLTIEPSDFRSRTFEGELGFAVSPRISLEGGFDVSRRAVNSEYRHFVSSNAQPIAQTTSLNQSGFLVGARFTPAGFGRRISRFAFIPRRVTPYVGGGVNLSYYDFRQRGDFVDFSNLAIFPDVFSSSGWTLGPYVRGGAHLQVWRRLYLNVDARYTWLHAGLESDFTGFDGIDLAAFRGATGFSLVF